MAGKASRWAADCVAERIKDAVDDWSDLIKLADERMYSAKKMGKACCVMCGGESLPPRGFSGMGALPIKATTT
jgi:hypothetical protein